MIILDKTMLRYQIALSLVKGLGTKGTRLFLQHIHNLEEAFTHPECIRTALPQLSNRIYHQFLDTAVLGEADRILCLCESEEITPHFILDEGHYPSRLSECPDAPIILYSKGMFEAWDERHGLSVVGTRGATSYGKSVTSALIGSLSEQVSGLVIVSGLAYGIDIQAHRSALELGLPTVAVLAHGLDTIYPVVHRREAIAMLEHGAWVSEYAPGVRARPSNFLARNRIIAGLTEATLVIEAGQHSGSLSTARLALEYNREVFAVPGRVNDSMSVGCHQLIEGDRAHLLSSAEGLIAEMGWGGERQVSFQPNFTAPSAPKAVSYSHPVLRALDEGGALTLDELARLLGRTIAAMSDELFELEMEGLIQAQPGGAYRLS